MDNGKIKTTPSWDKTKEQLWEEAFEGLEDPASVKRFFLFSRKMLMRSVAAALILLVLTLSGIFIPVRRYDSSIINKTSVYLPDSSMVVLNAGSTLSYNLISWFFNRKVKMDGEAYFEVVPGGSFNVKSNRGEVVVKGTSFNIFDRPEGYKVHCITGKVMVKSGGEIAELTKGKLVILVGDVFNVRDFENESEAIGWKNGVFSFNSVPLKDVIAEVERQFGIKVKVKGNNDYIYTGFFTKERSPEQVLEIIGKPFGIEFSIEK